MTSPHSLPEVRDEAERRAKRYQDAWRIASMDDDFGTPPTWDACSKEARESSVVANIAILCDFTQLDSRDWWVRWLTLGQYDAGARPCTCGRWTRFVGGTDADPEPECDACGKRPVYGGWVRRAWPCDWMRDRGVETPGVHAILLEASVRRVLAGKGPVKGLLRRDPDSRGAWALGDLPIYDRTAGEIALANGYALLDGDVVRVADLGDLL